jgi:alpha-D-xyloside xylohydrolase
MMRPLIMDWRTDEKVRDIGDEFLLGPSILVNPVTRENATERDVYLPPASAWYDFWTGAKLKGGARIAASAPLDRIPLYVKAGSILPLGPEVEYAMQSPIAPITLRIYRGGDATFDLYEDEGENYDYEKGVHAIIPLRWDDASSTLTIGTRQGSYPGMPSSRSFHVVLVDEHTGTGPKHDNDTGHDVDYNGTETKVTLK